MNVCVCVCVRLCVCVGGGGGGGGGFTPPHLESFICLEQLEWQSVCWRCVISTKSIYHQFRMKHRVFLTSHFILFTTRSDVSLSFRNAFIYHYQESPSPIATDLPLASDTHERGRNVTRTGYSDYKPRFWI